MLREYLRGLRGIIRTPGELFYLSLNSVWVGGNRGELRGYESKFVLGQWKVNLDQTKRIDPGVDLVVAFRGAPPRIEYKSPRHGFILGHDAGITTTIVSRVGEAQIGGWAFIDSFEK